MTRPDYGPNFDPDETREGDDERAEALALRREDAEDAREMAETGTSPEHYAEAEAEAYTERDFEMDVNL
jgi:hypothetical protein